MAEERVRQSGAAGSATFSGSDSRHFRYFKPEGRRATVYEDVTVDVQPDVSRYLIQGWIMSFADGTPSYHEGTTKLKSTDWHVFRAPDQEWERTHFQRQSRIETAIKTVVENGRSQGAPARFDPAWQNVLQDHVGAMKHAEFGLGVALTKAQRDGITQMINNAILTNSSYKMRCAQDVTLYLGDIGLDIDIDADAGKKHWLEDEAWQSTRKAVEAILAATDHLEVYFAINAIFEPLVGDFIRGGLISRAAPFHNDFMTPAVFAPALEDYQRNLANTMALFLLLVNDEEHGAANKELIGGWLEFYAPLCIDAAMQVRGVWGARDADSIDSAWNDAKQRFQNVLAELEITLPAGVKL